MRTCVLRSSEMLLNCMPANRALARWRRLSTHAVAPNERHLTLAVTTHAYARASDAPNKAHLTIAWLHVRTASGTGGGLSKPAMAHGGSAAAGGLRQRRSRAGARPPMKVAAHSAHRRLECLVRRRRRKRRRSGHVAASRARNGCSDLLALPLNRSLIHLLGTRAAHDGAVFASARSERCERACRGTVRRNWRALSYCRALGRSTCARAPHTRRGR